MESKFKDTRHKQKGKILVGWRDLRTGIFVFVSQLVWTSEDWCVPVFIKIEKKIKIKKEV